MNQAVIELLATGDEVVNGDVQDTNGSWMASQLAHRGFLLSRHQALPDDRELLSSGIRQISERADLCIVSGGLGPTEDDLTAAVVSQVTALPLELHAEAVQRMKERAARLGLRFSERNLQSARIPEGARVMHNEAGTAPAFSLVIGRCLFFFLPGPPREFQFFAERFVFPWVDGNLQGSRGAVAQLKTLGWPESHLAEKFEDFATLFPDIKVGYRAHGPEAWLKLTATAPSRELALKRLEPAEQEARLRLASVLFASGDDTIERVVHRLLLERGLTLATAESCTGGLVSSLLTANAGSSGYFIGGAITYSNALKTSLLGVDPKLLQARGAVSREVAESMACGARERLGADLAVAVTGIAGPDGGTAEKPVGLVYLAVVDGEGVQSLERFFRGDRERVQRASALTALEMVRRRLLGVAPLDDGKG